MALVDAWNRFSLPLCPPGGRRLDREGLSSEAKAKGLHRDVHSGKETNSYEVIAQHIPDVQVCS